MHLRNPCRGYFLLLLFFSFRFLRCQNVINVGHQGTFQGKNKSEKKDRKKG